VEEVRSASEKWRDSAKERGGKKGRYSKSGTLPGQVAGEAKEFVSRVRIGKGKREGKSMGGGRFGCVGKTILQRERSSGLQNGEEKLKTRVSIKAHSRDKT